MNQNKPKILIADDDPDDCMLDREALLEHHREMEIDTVEDAEQLLDYLQGRIGNGLPSLILLDYRLPGKESLEALREIRAHTDLTAIPVVIYSGSMPDKDARRAYELGAKSVVQKPHAFAEWSRIMRGVWSHEAGRVSQSR